MQTKPLILALYAGLALSGAAHAALHDRGGGLIYDDVLDVTWLQDANYAKTSGYDADGLMTWDQSMTWAANLSYFDGVRNVTYDDWRLPGVSPINGTAFNYGYSSAGDTDYGFNISAPGTAYAGATGSELSYMYYVNLGLTGFYNPDGYYNPNFGIFGNGTYGGQNDVGLIDNLQSYVYWSGTEYAPNSLSAWNFYTNYGYQIAFSKYNDFYAWAVRPGDVAAVPEADEWVMLLAGLGLVGVATRRRRG